MKPFSPILLGKFQVHIHALHNCLTLGTAGLAQMSPYSTLEFEPFLYLASEIGFSRGSLIPCPFLCRKNLKVNTHHTHTQTLIGILENELSDLYTLDKAR